MLGCHPSRCMGSLGGLAPSTQAELSISTRTLEWRLEAVSAVWMFTTAGHQPCVPKPPSLSVAMWRDVVLPFGRVSASVVPHKHVPCNGILALGMLHMCSVAVWCHRYHIIVWVQCAMYFRASSCSFHTCTTFIGELLPVRLTLHGVLIVWLQWQLQCHWLSQQPYWQAAERTSGLPADGAVCDALMHILWTKSYFMSLCPFLLLSSPTFTFSPLPSLLPRSPTSLWGPHGQLLPRQAHLWGMKTRNNYVYNILYLCGHIQL